MDGFWQAGHVPAETYAERALVASRLMKGLDPRIKTIACGSSTRLLPTYLEWDRKVLEYCWDSIDFLSVHRYSSNPRDDTASFLAEGVVIDQVLTEYRGLLSYVRGRKRDSHDVRLCFDEWNVWYRERSDDGGWGEAPHLLEERYNLEDALVCAQYLNSFVRNADIVSIACIAQIVNVIAPILTRADGLLLQTIYWPFKLLRDAISGEALHAEVRVREMSTDRRGDVPALDAAATIDDAQGTACVSLVNRDPDGAVDVAIDIADAAFNATSAHVLAGDVRIRNEWDAPDAIRPQPIDVNVDDHGVLHITLPAASHAVVSLERSSR
jgi:alpha-N-arabinofuranosidase